MIKYICGHDSSLPDDADNTWRKMIIEGKPCPNCERAIYKQNENAPDLTGTEKQIEWATNIRGRWMAVWTANNLDARPLLEARTSAKWWIEQRYELARFFEDEIDKIRRQAQVKEDEAVDWAAIQEQHDALMHPEDPITGEVVIVASDEWCAVARAAQYVAPLREIAKSHGFRWDKERGSWSLEQPLCVGDYGDRAAEVGRALLDGGVPIECHDADVRRKIRERSWAKREPKWVAYFTREKKFAIYSDDDESILQAAMKIARARNYSKRGYIEVPLVCADQVADFADTHGLAMSETAAEILKEFEQEVACESLLDTD